MLVKNLPDMIRYLKARGTCVLFNTNGTLMQPKQFRELIDTGLDELRVSLDAADRETGAPSGIQTTRADRGLRKLLTKQGLSRHR